VHEGSGNLVFRIKPDPPRDEWKPVRMTVVVRDVADLWRVCLKSQHARVEIPELEFEISADGKRHIDSIYNHIASAVYNLGQHVRQCKGALSADHADKIMDTVIALNAFLDVPKPWTWIVHDPSGISEMKPLEGVVVEHPAAEGAAPEAAATQGGEGSGAAA
jgi:C4-type Zn-finger protein